MAKNLPAQAQVVIIGGKRQRAILLETRCLTGLLLQGSKEIASVLREPGEVM